MGGKAHGLRIASLFDKRRRLSDSPLPATILVPIPA